MSSTWGFDSSHPHQKKGVFDSKTALFSYFLSFCPNSAQKKIFSHKNLFRIKKEPWNYKRSKALYLFNMFFCNAEAEQFYLQLLGVALKVFFCRQQTSLAKNRTLRRKYQGIIEEYSLLRM